MITDDSRTRVCKKCGICKVESQFVTVHGNKFSDRCLRCRKLVSMKTKANGRTDKPRLAWAHGLTKIEYDQMLEQQCGGCAICKQVPGKRRLCVDHCHTSGKIRGLLCIPCNIALGSLKDDPQRMLAAINYITADYSNARTFKAFELKKEL